MVPVVDQRACTAGQAGQQLAFWPNTPVVSVTGSSFRRAALPRPSLPGNFVGVDVVGCPPGRPPSARSPDEVATASVSTMDLSVAGDRYAGMTDVDDFRRFQIGALDVQFSTKSLWVRPSNTVAIDVVDDFDPAPNIHPWSRCR